MAMTDGPYRCFSGSCAEPFNAWEKYGLCRFSSASKTTKLQHSFSHIAQKRVDSLISLYIAPISRCMTSAVVGGGVSGSPHWILSGAVTGKSRTRRSISMTFA